ncbi:allatostatin-A receptor-like [Diadema antillarum]|uniref:allatostatin-A receptor-like n=1 Tax=Diadema antillarum TaxID=105358 RepID=UPI003A86369E
MTKAISIHAVVTSTSAYGDDTSLRPVGWTLLPFRWTWWVALQIFSAVLGIVGNAIVIAVIASRRSETQSTGILIKALAVADLLTSVFLIPIPTAMTVPSTVLGEFYCRFIYPLYHRWVTVYASIYILTATSVERYVAVAHPIYFNRFVTKRNVHVLVGILWFLAAIVSGIGRFTNILDHKTHTCQVKFYSYAGLIFTAIYLLSFGLLIPVVIMFVSQALVVCSLQRQSKVFKQQANNSTAPSFHLVARKRVIRLMMLVIAGFVICWTPIQLYVFLFSVGVTPRSLFYGTPLFQTFIVLGFYNSCLNPINYTMRHAKFRMAVKDLFSHTSKTSTGPVF